MLKIKKLPPEVINKIAAGEVVERPASVLKELIENSIDAGATEIIINLIRGGIELIEVIDNGHGIPKEELGLALEKNSTSKIIDIDDINNLDTYGFRGEALASISAVSNFTIISKTSDQRLAYQLRDGLLTPSARNRGTTIKVENLFHNVPARKKFLKGEDTEYKYCLDIFNDFAILYPKLKFRLTNNRKIIFDFYGTESAENRIVEITNYKELLKIEETYYDYKISGYTLYPKDMGEKSRFLKVYINRRPIRDKGIENAFRMAFRDYSPSNLRPSGVLFLEIPKNQVDVNAHPRKIEVRFENPFRIFEFIRRTVSDAVGKVVKSDFSIHPLQNGSINSLCANKNYTGAPKLSENIGVYTLDRKRPLIFKDSAEPNYGRRKQISSKLNSTKNEQVAYSYDENIRISSNIPIEAEDIVGVYQLFNSYILVEFDSEFWIIDQHAAAERIRYEKLLSKLELTSQKLLTPIKFFLNSKELINLKEISDLLSQLSFTYKLEGTELSITSVPLLLQNANIESLIRDLLADTEDKELDKTERIKQVIATIACHSSLRANNRITETEAKATVMELLKCEYPYACPHGRSLIWKIRREELERRFMR